MENKGRRKGRGRGGHTKVCSRRWAQGVSKGEKAQQGHMEIEGQTRPLQDRGWQS